MTESALFLFGSALLEPFRYTLKQIHPGASAGRGELTGLLINLILFGTVAWFLRQGSNWARWVSFVLCILCLLELASLNDAHTLGKVLSTIYDAGLAAFLLVFLNTRAIRDWFTHKTTAVPPPPLG